MSERRWWQVAWLAVGVGVVVRTWGIGGQDLTFDESFTAAASRKPVGDLLGFLRDHDSHPPLDYLLRIPFAASANDLVVRLPSVAASIASLLLLARWMRSKGPFGAFTTIAAAVMPLLVAHGREARMYSLVMLLGTIAAICAEHWIAAPSGRLAAAVAACGSLAMLSHSAAIPAVASMGLLPGLRRDRAAWVYRAWLAAAFVLWAALWGPSFREQSATASDPGYWVPHTSLEWVETVGGALISARSALIHVSFAVLLLGIGALLARCDATARVAFVAFVVPFAVLIVAGLELRLLLPRSLAFGAWAVAAGLGAGAEWLRGVGGVRGGVLGVLLLVALLVPSTLDLVRTGREELVELDVLRDRLRPGDEISMGPSWFRPLLEWNFVAKRDFKVVRDDDERFVIADRSAPRTGRVHLLDSQGLPLVDVAGDGEPCEVPFTAGAWLLRCVEDDP